MDAEQLLLNWALWARTRRAAPCSCRSIESRYRPPPVWHYPEIRVDPDIKEALLVERTLTSSTFPKQQMVMLVWCYVYKWYRAQKVLRLMERFETTRKIKLRDITHKYGNKSEFQLESERIFINRFMFDHYRCDTE